MATQVDTTTLADTPFFAGLPDADLAELAERMRVAEVEVGGVLASEGEQLRTQFYLVLDGHVTVHREGRHVADLGPGDVFGEAGAAKLQPRNATVIATTPATVASVLGWDLREVMERSPALAARVDEILEERSGG